MMAPKMKFCGNRTLSDYQLTVNSLADYIGFVFYKGSKRYVQPEVVAGWTRLVQKGKNQQLVGVWVNPNLNEIEDVLRTVDLDIIQMHGKESPEWLKYVKAKFNRKVWKAIHHDSEALDTMRSYKGIVDGFVIDSKTENLWGGTGRSFNWSFIPNYQVEAERQGVHCWIAGGISSTNVKELLMYQPFGIDIASGIEYKGEKSVHLIRDMERKVVGLDESFSR